VSTPFSIEISISFGSTPGISTRKVKALSSSLISIEGAQLAVDSIYPKAANQLLGEIHKITDKPVKYVVYSHNHHDHISGGMVFKDQGATFIAHKNVLKELGDHPRPATPLPDITFEDEYTVQFGGRTFDLKYFGPNHGESL
jgi:glyoxylase-like metal-dependent hydrolase (beta-lactamase superfamily II)